MATTWIDFRSLREQLDIAAVLEHYGVAIKQRRGDQVSCLCPLPDHPVRHEPGRRTPSFSANVRKGCWHCFGCGESGNVIDLAVYLRGDDPADREAVRAAAMELADAFKLRFDRPAEGRRRGQRDERLSSAKRRRPSDDDGDELDDPPPQTAKKPSDAVHPNGDSAPEHPERSQLPTLVNPPLDFELRHLDPSHPYLASRGFTPETVATFGLGFCGRGMLNDRIAIPLHDPAGQLVGYAGRLADDARIGDDMPKYLFPSSRERDGTRIEFRKSHLLYNAHRIAKPVGDLIVVEGFTSVWHFHQLGHVTVVALMGSSCSDEQADIITSLVRGDGHVWVLSDGDAAGIKCAESALRAISTKRFCRWVPMKDGQQPTDLTGGDIEQLISVEVD